MERPVLLLKRILPSLSIHSLALVDIDPAIMGPQQDGLFEQSLLFPSF